jgi:hypothetical protein
MSALPWLQEQSAPLRGVAVRALLALVSQIEASGAGEVSLSYPVWAKLAGCSRAALVPAVTDLEDRGLVLRDRVPGGRANVYRVPSLVLAGPRPISGRGAPVPRLISGRGTGPEIRRGTSGQVIENKATSEVKPNSPAPVPYLLTNKDCREEEVSKCAETGAVAAIVQTLKDCFQEVVMPGNPKLDELLNLALQLEVPLDSLPDYLRDLRASRRPDYQFTLGLIVLAASKGGLETWKLRRKPPARAASRFERPPLESGPPMSQDEQVEFWLRILAKEPDHVQGNAEMARLRPRALAAGAGL